MARGVLLNHHNKSRSETRRRDWMIVRLRRTLSRAFHRYDHGRQQRRSRSSGIAERSSRSRQSTGKNSRQHSQPEAFLPRIRKRFFAECQLMSERQVFARARG